MIFLELTNSSLVIFCSIEEKEKERKKERKRERKKEKKKLLLLSLLQALNSFLFCIFLTGKVC
jgi:hypothetical protein